MSRVRNHHDLQPGGKECHLQRLNVGAEQSLVARDQQRQARKAGLAEYPSVVVLTGGQDAFGQEVTRKGCNAQFSFGQDAEGPQAPGFQVF